MSNLPISNLASLACTGVIINHCPSDRKTAHPTTATIHGSYRSVSSSPLTPPSSTHATHTSQLGTDPLNSAPVRILRTDVLARIIALPIADRRFPRRSDLKRQVARVLRHPVGLVRRDDNLQLSHRAPRIRKTAATVRKRIQMSIQGDQLRTYCTSSATRRA